MFKKGLPNRLNIGIITNNNLVPATLEDWINAARQQELKYLQTQEFSKKGLSNQELALTKKLGVCIPN